MPEFVTQTPDKVRLGEVDLGVFSPDFTANKIFNFITFGDSKFVHNALHCILDHPFVANDQKIVNIQNQIHNSFICCLFQKTVIILKLLKTNLFAKKPVNFFHHALAACTRP